MTFNSELVPPCLDDLIKTGECLLHVPGLPAVILNDKTIIDNQPILGCTGGAITSDESNPGPIYLQGDHTNVDYRNMLLRPVVR